MTFENDYSSAYAIPGLRRNIEMNDIMQVVKEYFNINTIDIFKRCRKREVVYHRQICIYILITKANMNLPALAAMFRQDHTSIMYARDVVKTQLSIKHDTPYRRDINNILNKL